MDNIALPSGYYEAIGLLREYARSNEVSHDQIIDGCVKLSELFAANQFRSRRVTMPDIEVLVGKPLQTALFAEDGAPRMACYNDPDSEAHPFG